MSPCSLSRSLHPTHTGQLTHLDILNFRKAMWDKVSARSHHPIEVYPFGPQSDTVMIYGTVDYSFKAGGNGGLSWAARGTLELDEKGEVVRWKSYQVFLDSAAQVARN